jgi:hypothetical protein
MTMTEQSMSRSFLTLFPDLEVAELSRVCTTAGITCEPHTHPTHDHSDIPTATGLALVLLTTL